MSIEFDPSADLFNVADGLETVTLYRRGSTSGGIGKVITRALRRAMTAGEAAIVNSGDVRKKVSSGGRSTAADLTWHLPVAELPVSPRLGDVIVDADSQRWTILEVKQATVGSRWRCTTRNVAIAFGLDDTVTILKAAYAKSGCGAAETTWRIWKSGIRARIQPLKAETTADDQSRGATLTYRIFVEEDLDLDHTCCIRGADGTIYTIKNTTGADRIGELQVIEAETTR